MIHELSSLGAVVGFLVAMMVLARACADEGLFAAWSAIVARASTTSWRRLALIAAVVAGAASVLTAHAAVVLLAPALLVAMRSTRRLSALAAVRLANTGSTLLPVSNLTTLLVFGATGFGFVQFAWFMLPTWLVGIAAEVSVLRWWFRDDLSDAPGPEPVEAMAVPLFPGAVVVVVVLGLAGGATPWVPAAAGAILAGGYALARGTTTWRDLLDAANVPLALLVLVWGWVVIWLRDTRAAEGVGDLVPTSQGLGALLVTALVAMVAANVVSNLPATLLLLPAAAAAGPITVLALVIGVTVGANLTAIGSLTNLLWKQSLPADVTSWRTFHAVGVVATPVIVVLCTSVLWAWTSLLR